MKACCIIGPTKSGTTLMGCLLDSHPDVAIFPLEVKYFSHWFERLSRANSTYSDLNMFFLQKSKLAFLNNNSQATDVMNSGRIDIRGFNFTNFFTEMENKEFDYSGISSDQLFSTYLVDIHKALKNGVSWSADPEILVSKEGNHGLPHMASIDRIFPNTKFIVLIRDPRDIYSSLKSIAKKKSEGVYTPTFKQDTSPLRYVFENTGKNILSYAGLFGNSIDRERIYFVRYEDLVSDTGAEMEGVARFLGIPFREELCVPTVFGRPWDGNSSSMERFKGISVERKEKWRTELNSREVRVLEYFLRPYIESAGYSMSGTSLARLAVARDIVFTNYKAWTVNWREVLGPISSIAKIVLSTTHGLIKCFRSEHIP